MAEELTDLERKRLTNILIREAILMVAGSKDNLPGKIILMLEISISLGSHMAKGNLKTEKDSTLGNFETASRTAKVNLYL